MADIIYTLEGGVYLNITNKCPCNCAFCIRTKGDAVGEAERLWFDTEPTIDEIKEAIDAFDFTQIESAVFCGYGEPTNAYDNLIESARYIKSINPSIQLRLNTNGLSDLINQKPTICTFNGYTLSKQRICLDFLNRSAKTGKHIEITIRYSKVNA